MLSTYRRALALPGAWQFSLTGFVARLPIAMVGLGIVLLISTTTGSYAQAGVMSAAFQVSAAFGAVATSRWADRVGQHRLLPWLGGLNAAALIGFVVAVENGLAFVVQLLVVAVAGAAQPSIGSMVRARWATAAPDTGRLRGAFALESIIDELIFSIGPLLTAFLAFQIALPLPLIAGAAIGLAGAVTLALQRSTEPVPSRQRPGGDSQRPRGSALRQPGLIIVVIGALGIGGVFGSYEVAVVAFTQQADASETSGIVLGLWALGSMLSGIVFGSRQWRLPLPRQVVVLSALLALVLVPAPFVQTVPLLAGASFLAGVGVAPALIANFSLTERLVPANLLTEGLTWTNSGLALGFSAGTTLGGIVIDAHGTTWAFILPIASASMAAITAAIGQPVLTRASSGRRQPPPAPSWNAEPVPGPAAFGVLDAPDRTESR